MSELLLRKSALFTMRFQTVPALGVGDLLSGQLATTTQEQLVAMSSLTGCHRRLSGEEHRILSHIPSGQWMPAAQVAGDLAVSNGAIDALLEDGFLLGDTPEGRIATLREQEEKMLALDWDDFAALYHVQSRVHDLDVAAPLRQAAAMQPTGDQGPPPGAPFQDFLALGAQMSAELHAKSEHFDPPPPPFHKPRNAEPVQNLPLPEGDSAFQALLRHRKTTRVFDQNRPLGLQELSTVLYYTFGCFGHIELAPGLIGLRKTSPSGGSLHPIEAYPLILNVENVHPGIYHYDVERHGLSLLRPMTLEEARHHAVTFTLGQSYFGSAHALVLLTARWFRNFWKYRKAQKSYRVIHVDAGHLSQTLYLLCTEMGLGAFYTGAINDINIEQALDLDPLQEGVIGVAGCGQLLPGGGPLTLETLPYVPPR